MGSVQVTTITFGNVTIGTKNGSKAALEFSFGSAKMTAVLDMGAATPTSQDNLVGTWTISPKATGRAVTFQVISVSGREGTGTVYKNTIMFDGAQVSSDDGKSEKLTFQSAHQTFSIATAKVIPKTTRSSVNIIA